MVKIPEIVERGLMIGFGLTILIFMASYLSPFVSYFNNYQLNQDYDKFIYTLDFGIKNSLQNHESELKFNCYLIEEVKIFTYYIDNTYLIEVKSEHKNSTLFSSCNVIFNQTSINGSFKMLCNYNEDVKSIHINFSEVNYD